MRASGLLATALLVAMAACGRTALDNQRHSNGGDTLPGNNPGTGGSGGVARGTGGAATAATADAGWATGGSAGFGGAAATGGTTSTRGTGGTAGTSRTGGAVGMGGSSRTGGAPASGGNATGGRFGSGGSAAGGSIGSGGRTGMGGGVGGIGRDAGSTGGSSSAGGATASGGTAGAGGIGARGGSLGRGGSSGGGGVATGGTMGQGGAGGTAGTCGDGTIGPGEQCDLGTGNQASSAFWVTQSGLSFAAVPLARSEFGAEFYDYRSSSAHTGFEAVGTGRIMLYLDRTMLKLSLIVFHGVDQDSTGLEQPRSQVQMLFSGLPDSTYVEVADDSSAEFTMTSSTTATGLWTFTSNSDGGVLSGLPFPGDWKITIEPTFMSGISTWTWIESDGSLVNLDLTQPLTIEARSSHGQCRPDCTAPQCGDGILDGGEICDDSQPSKSGCSTNCMSFN